MYTDQVAVIGPGTELHKARLFIKWEVLHIYLTERLIDGRGFPHHFPCVMEYRLRHDGHLVVPVGTETHYRFFDFGRDRKFFKILGENPEWKNLLRRPRRKWEKNFEMDLKETGFEDMDWFHLDQDRSISNSDELFGFCKGWEIIRPLADNYFLGRPLFHGGTHYIFITW